MNDDLLHAIGEAVVEVGHLELVVGGFMRTLLGDIDPEARDAVLDEIMFKSQIDNVSRALKATEHPAGPAAHAEYAEWAKRARDLAIRRNKIAHAALYTTSTDEIHRVSWRSGFAPLTVEEVRKLAVDARAARWDLLDILEKFHATTSPIQIDVETGTVGYRSFALSRRMQATLPPGFTWTERRPRKDDRPARDTTSRG